MKKEIYIVIILILCTLFTYGQEEIITITGDGNVGINNTSPQDTLDMEGDLFIDGVLYSDTFTPLVKYYDLDDPVQRTCTLPDAETVMQEVIIFWKGGNSSDKVLTIQTEENQTIDGKTSTDWNGEGRGKMRILPYNGHWIVLYYIDRRHQHVPLESGTYHTQTILEDPEWNKNWVILNKNVTLNIAETAIIDKSNFVYHKNWALCFIPSAAQFYNFEKAKGTTLLVLSVPSFLESMIAGYFMIDHYYNTYLPARNNYQNDDIDFSRINNTQQILSIATITGIRIFGIFFTYSCIDGIITMDHLYGLLYPNNSRKR